LLSRWFQCLSHNLGAAKTNFVSSGVVVNHKDHEGFSKAFLVRDPDGHAVEIAER